MLSLNDLRSPAAGLDWHEAVAVGAALGTLLVDTQAPACPRPADVALLPSGDLRVTGGRHVEGSAAAGVAFLLSELLDLTPCPAELRQLVDVYATDRRDGSDDVQALATFVAELQFFERPARREVLAAVALRAEPAIERARHTAALDALTERTRQATASAAVPAPAAAGVTGAAGTDADAEADPPSGGWDPRPHDGAGHLLVPATVALVAFLGVAYGTAAWLNKEAPPPPRPAEVVDDEAAPAIPGSDPRPGDTPASPRAPRTRPPAGPTGERHPEAVTPGAASIAAPGTAAVRPPTAAASTPRSAAPPRTVDVTVAERDGRVVPSPIAPQRPVTRPATTGRVFQAGDPQVVPAVLIRPKLPDEPPPDVPEEQIGTLEFVVAESGAVEHVHLVSPGNRYQERMLVAAAKTWQFRPATYDGRPVRFRTRIRVTL